MTEPRDTPDHCCSRSPGARPGGSLELHRDDPRRHCAAATSGRRTAVWRPQGNDGLLRSGDPVIAVRSDEVTALTTDGGLRWRWSGPTGDHQDQAGCNDLAVTGAAEVALVRVTDPCDEGDDLFVGLDAETGTELWRHRQNGQRPLVEAVAEGQYIRLAEDRREVSAQHVSTGRPVWSVDRDHARRDCADPPQLSSSAGTAYFFSCVADPEPAATRGGDRIRSPGRVTTLLALPHPTA